MARRLLMLGCIATLVFTGCGSGQGASSPAAAADAYVRAIASGDANAVQKVTPPDFDAKAEIADKLAKYVGVDTTRLRTILVPHDVTPNIVTVRISSEVSNFEDVIDVQRFGTSGWFVLLGRLRGFSPGGPTSGTRPPTP